ncbi:MAG: RsmE family RNA methyltransferase [Candidatus Melainabacteria bacterium]|nr:RsmE family RNA methyltransferase [Candidatus Melainabacteria bacterium]
MVRSYRFAINKEDDLIDVSNKIITTKKQNLIHQLIKVLRYPEDEGHNNIELIDGFSRNVYEVRLLTEIGSKILKKIDFEIVDLKQSPRELDTYVNFYVPIIKNENFELMLRKLCELGVQEFTPVFFKFSQKKYLRKLKEHSYQERILKIIESATEQCEGSVFAKLNPVIGFEDLIRLNQKIDKDTIKLFASERLSLSEGPREKAGIKQGGSKDMKKVSLLIGPEGGLSIEEVEALEKTDFKGISLGKRILRAETAAVVLFTKLGLI